LELVQTASFVLSRLRISRQLSHIAALTGKESVTGETQNGNVALFYFFQHSQASNKDNPRKRPDLISLKTVCTLEE
jgi:hypothetical protein